MERTIKSIPDSHHLRTAGVSCVKDIFKGKCFGVSALKINSSFFDDDDVLRKMTDVTLFTFSIVTTVKSKNEYHNIAVKRE